jgi:uncharacterized iron-regulated membrane protein
MDWRKYHRYVALVFTLPLIFVAISGVMLQLRNQFEWIQPSPVTATMSSGEPVLSFEKIITDHGKDSIDQIIYRPQKKNLAIRLKDGTELQIHPQTGIVLKQAMRRTNFLIDLHQGTWIGKIGQFGIYFPTALAFCFLIISGIVIYPFKKRRSV